MSINISKPKTFGKKRNNKGYSPRKSEAKQHWVKSDHLKVGGVIG